MLNNRQKPPVRPFFDDVNRIDDSLDTLIPDNANSPYDMKELILNIQEKTMEEQRSILNSTIEAWRGDYAQIDDILIIGRKF